jgi:hypothetical protein
MPPVELGWILVLTACNDKASGRGDVLGDVVDGVEDHVRLGVEGTEGTQAVHLREQMVQVKE